MWKDAKEKQGNKDVQKDGWKAVVLLGSMSYRKIFKIILVIFSVYDFF